MILPRCKRTEDDLQRVSTDLQNYGLTGKSTNRTIVADQDLQYQLGVGLNMYILANRIDL